MLTMFLDVFVPPFGLLALGAVLRRVLLQDDSIWAGIERLVFYVLMPALLCSAIGSVDLAQLPLGRMAGAIWLALAAGAVLSLALARLARLPHPAVTSVFQGGIRFNNLMGFAVTAGLFGQAGTALSAVATGLIVPCVQLMTSLVFALGRPGGGSMGQVVRQLGLNPLLLACVAGFGVAALGGLPAGVAPLARSLGQASIGLGLLCVGAALSPAALAGRWQVQWATSVVKLVACPALLLGCGWLLGLEGLALGVAFVFMALPTATTSYVMARAMGGDAPLMAALTTLEHLLAVVTLPLWILLLGYGRPG